MYPDIWEEYSKLLDIYSSEKPDFLLPFLDSPSLQRLTDIDQNCGSYYCKFYDYKRKHVRLAHSIWVALIIRHFTHDEKQTLAWLFHDVSHSIFSHVWDFLLWDAENQEASEQYMVRVISEDPIISRELEKLGISISEVDDYTRYPIADNHGPQLSADRLEYTLSSGLNLWYISHEEIQSLYENIELMKDENGMPEIWFSDKNLAKQFALLALKNDSTCFSSYKSTVAMYFVAEILRKMLERELVTFEQLYTWTDSDAIQLIENSWDSEISEMWNFYKHLWTYKIYDHKPESDYFVVSSKNKRRYINPLVKIDGVCTRVSVLFPDLQEMIDAHVNKPEEWIEIDWKVN